MEEEAKIDDILSLYIGDLNKKDQRQHGEDYDYDDQVKERNYCSAELDDEEKKNSISHKEEQKG